VTKGTDRARGSHRPAGWLLGHLGAIGRRAINQITVLLHRSTAASSLKAPICHALSIVLYVLSATIAGMQSCGSAVRSFGGQVRIVQLKIFADRQGCRRCERGRNWRCWSNHAAGRYRLAPRRFARHATRIEARHIAEADTCSRRRKRPAHCRDRQTDHGESCRQQRVAWYRTADLSRLRSRV
jgi:hypothetical protein